MLMWQMGGVTAQPRTTGFRAAIRHLPKEEQEPFSERSQARMRHSGRAPTCSNAGSAHENGAVDAENTTGAVRLYAQAEMRIDWQYDH
jgi:hypothetical protein